MFVILRSIRGLEKWITSRCLQVSKMHRRKMTSKHKVEYIPSVTLKFSMFMHGYMNPKVFYFLVALYFDIDPQKGALSVLWGVNCITIC